MSGDLISWIWRLSAAGSAEKPGRASTLSGRNFLPHQEPM
jgi:hypothetical protein